MKANYEQTVIGTILKNPSELESIDLLADDFEIESLKLIYQQILDMYVDNKVIDIFTVSTELEKTSPGNPWLALVGQAQVDAMSARSLISHANHVKRESKNRKAKLICSELLDRIDSNDELLDEAVKELMELNQVNSKHEHTIKETLSHAVTIIEASCENEGITGIPTGIKQLDDVLGGFHESDLYVVGARPAMGKTAFLLNLANAHNESSGLISAEQPAEQIGLRLIAINGKINAQNMRNGTMDDFEFAKLTSSMSRLQDKNIWINDKSGINIIEIIRQARKWKHQHDIKIIYIDYIQRIKWTDQRIAKWEQVGNVVGALKELARDLNIPIVALAQVNRDVEKLADKRPSMGHLANSSEIEKEADVIMTLYRDEVYNPDTDDKGIMEVNVCKNRHGQIGNVRTLWLQQFMKIEDYDNRAYAPQH